MSDQPARLSRHVRYLAADLGERNPFHYANLEQARKYIESELAALGYAVSHDVFQVDGRTYRNVITESEGQTRDGRVFILGAHYDTAPGTPGADDNASGVAMLLEMAAQLREADSEANIRFVAFTLEESPYFRTEAMGSMVHALKCKKRGENIVGMASLEMVGYYRDGEHSQGYPLPFMRWFFPDCGNFIAVAGNFHSRHLVGKMRRLLTQSTDMPVESIALPLVPGTGLSDNWAFWRAGFPAVMITDTAFFRNPHYHLPSDRPETLDYEKMAVLLSGLCKMAARV